MLKNVKKSRKMAKKKNLTTFDQNEYDIRDQRPKKHNTHETVTSVWIIIKF